MSKNRVPHRKQYIDGRLQDPPCNLKRKTQCRKRSKPTFTHGFAFGNALRPAYQISQAWLNEAKTPAQWKHSLCCPTWTVALCYDTSCSVVMLCYMILVCCVVIHIIFRSRVVCCVLVHAMFCFVRYNEEGWAERWRRLQQVSIRKSQGGTGGEGGSKRKSQVRIRISQDRIRRATHSIRKNTMPIYGEISSIRGEPMSIRNQPCPRRDGGMEVDGDVEVGSIKIKSLSIKINTQPI